MVYTIYMEKISNLIKETNIEPTSKARSEWEFLIDEVMDITKYNRGRVLKMLKGLTVGRIRTLLHESDKPEIKNKAAWLQWKIKNERDPRT